MTQTPSPEAIALLDALDNFVIDALAGSEEFDEEFERKQLGFIQSALTAYGNARLEEAESIISNRVIQSHSQLTQDVLAIRALKEEPTA